MDTTAWFNGSAWYLAFLFSTTVHEASHALVALWLGDSTAAQGGQVSLDPIPHIRREPVGMILAPIVSFWLGGWMLGWASAPYDPFWAARYPRRAATMAMAGPASNLLLCVAAGLLIHLGISAGWFQPPAWFGVAPDVAQKLSGNAARYAQFAGTLLSILFDLNVILFGFNLIPFPPLDGGSIPMFFLSRESCARYTAFLRSPGMSMTGMILAWLVFGKIAPTLEHWAIALLCLG